MAEEFEVERLPVIVSFDETALYSETYGFAGTSGTVFLEGQRLIPKGKAADTVLLFMHPSSTPQLMPLPAALARAAFTCSAPPAATPRTTPPPSWKRWSSTRAPISATPSKRSATNL